MTLNEVESDEEKDGLIRLKRLRHRSRQRGFAEADEIFMAFARDHLDGLSPTELDQYENLLALPDWDSFAWITDQAEPPAEFAEIVALMRQKILRR